MSWGGQVRIPAIQVSLPTHIELAFILLSVAKLQAAINQVVTKATYKGNAVRLQSAIHRAGGVTQAIYIVEQVVATGEPVLSRADD